MMANKAETRVGTSGWIYRHWKHIFYPDRLPQSRWFEFYSQTFDTVEVNFTFYRLPQARVFESWNRKAPDGFIFALKGSQYVTHMKRLIDCRPHVDTFFERAKPLGDHVGPILWQLPPRFSRDDSRLADFLEILPSSHQHALEFRHESWLVEDVFSVLRSRDVALCIADSPRNPGRVVLTADWTYIRFHEGVNHGDYTDSQLRKWADEIRNLRQHDIQTWTYFNNDPHGYAIKNALSLRQDLELPPPET